MFAIFKNCVIVFFLPLTMVLNTYLDNRACDIYNQNLKIIKERLDDKSFVSVAKISSAIDFFEGVTGIQSHSDGDFAGSRYSPTKEDYANWKKWFKKNKNRLYWDNHEQRVKVRPSLVSVLN